MVKSFTFWLVAISIMVLISVLIIAFCIKTDKDKLSLGTRLAGFYIIAAIGLITMIFPMETTYIDGEVIENITSVKWNDKDDKYDVITTSGKNYKIENGLTSDNTFISLNCKIVNENIFGMKIYTEDDIVFVDTSDSNMSESEKHHVLDRVVQK